MASAEQPVPALSGPPKKGQGPKPSFVQTFVAPKGVQRSLDVPVSQLSPALEADKTLFMAREKAQGLKKKAEPAGGRSIQSVQVSFPKGAGASASAPKAAPFTLAGLLSSNEDELTEAPAEVAEVAEVVDGVESEGPAPSIQVAVPESAEAEPAEAEAEPVADFKDVARPVEEKLTADPIKVHPADDIFMPINRRGIHKFIVETYQTYILKKPRIDPVGDACKEMSKVSSTTIENFAYQEFVRDYMQRGSPYRGLLVYHGLGSGKTCTSIAAMEGLRYGGARKIFVMTPATLSPNYHRELSLCGYYGFKKENYWEQVQVPENSAGTALDEASSQFVFLTATYGLSPQYLNKKYARSKKTKFWVADPSRAVNFESLSPEQKKEIEEQILAHMDDRFQFIHYNGLREARVREWICGTPTNPTPGNLFDNSVVVIDEVHNLIRTIVGSDLENIFKTEPRGNTKEDAEWRANYQSHAKICGMPKKYKIAYGVYRLLCDAVGCKIISLSGTPIINKPHEIAVLSNILAGDRRIAKVAMNPAVNEDQVHQVLLMNPSVDFFEFTTSKGLDGVSYRQLMLTAVPSGLRKVVGENGEFKGFMRLDEEEPDMRERNLPVWFERDVLPGLGGLSNILGKPVYNTLPQLPDTEKEFVESFVDKEKLLLKNTISLRARLTGLISYYKGSKKELVATVTKDELVTLDMSDWQLSKYLAERKAEMELESKPPEKAMAVGSIAGLTLFESNLYAQATKSVNSAFKIFSRAACNFVFPDGINRPRPNDSKKAAALLGVKEEAEEADGVDDEAKELKAAQQLEISQTTRAGKLESFLSDDENAQEEAKVADQAEMATEGEIRQVTMEYGEALKDSIMQLRARAADVFAPGKLQDFSPKYAGILERVSRSKGPVLIYSQFKTLEGLGLFATACEYQEPGYVKIDIVKSEGKWSLTDAFKAPENKGKERYIMFTGDDDREKREILLDMFNFNVKVLKMRMKSTKEIAILAGNQPNNFTGKICRMFMITQSGAEGISLKNVRQVHMMEPFWNYVRLEQVQGRAIRICSHKDLPLEDRNVEVYTYLMKFSEQQKRDRKVDESIAIRDKGLTTDQIIYTLMMTKRRLSEQMFDVMKSAAIDCLLNALEHGSKSCFMITSGGPLFLYHPDYKEDIKEAQSQYKVKDEEVVVEQPAAVAEAVAAEVPVEREARVEASEASIPPGLAGAELDASRQPNVEQPAPPANENQPSATPSLNEISNEIGAKANKGKLSSLLAGSLNEISNELGENANKRKLNSLLAEPVPNASQAQPRLNNRGNIDRNEGALNNIGPAMGPKNENAPSLGLGNGRV
jgi:hypothetical protein